jgi:hypothetical protein
MKCPECGSRRTDRLFRKKRDRVIEEGHVCLSDGCGVQFSGWFERTAVEVTER